MRVWDGGEGGSFGAILKTTLSLEFPPLESSAFPDLAAGKLCLAGVLVGLGSLLVGLFLVGLDSDSSCELPDSWLSSSEKVYYRGRNSNFPVLL